MKKRLIIVSLMLFLILPLVYARSNSTIIINGTSNTVELIMSGATAADVKISINGAVAIAMNAEQASSPYSPQKVGGLNFILRDILYQGYVGGIKEADFYIGFETNLTMNNSIVNFSIDGSPHNLTLLLETANSATLRLDDINSISTNVQTSPPYTLSSLGNMRVVLTAVKAPSYIGDLDYASLIIFYESNLSINDSASCTPNWTAINTTCAANDRKTQWFNDTNKCNQAPPANLTLTCDSDSNGVMGNLTNFTSISTLTAYINSSTNLTRTMSGIQKVELKTENYTAIEFDWNFSQALDLDRMYIERQSSSASRGYILIRGIPASKKVLVQKLTDSTKICVRNAELNSISELTANCTGSNEILLDCPGSYSSISCSIENNFFIVNGLTSSAVRETFSTAGNCTSNWNCTAWTTCKSGSQTRNCTDIRACNSSMLKKTDTQTCSPPTPSCTSNWLCANWTACSKEGNKARICTDKNYCNSTSDNKKTETDTCEYKEASNIMIWIIIIVIAGIIIGVIILIISFLKKKPNTQEYTQIPPPQTSVTQYGYSSQQGNQGFNNSGM